MTRSLPAPIQETGVPNGFIFDTEEIGYWISIVRRKSMVSLLLIL